MAKVKDVFREDQKPITELHKGVQLLYEIKGKSYPVQFIAFKGYQFYFSITCNIIWIILQMSYPHPNRK